MERFVLTDAQWTKMEPHCLGKPIDPVEVAAITAASSRLCFGSCARGSPWRDLPAFFGSWNSIFKRYRDWVKADVFIRLFERLFGPADMELHHGGRNHRQVPPPWPRRKRGT
ncbi:transposase [Mesorhizobium sp. M0621]|uniref:transposase n=1 Tax=Mesorhizobium sp. M0621 TaxID=2956974 RepID=UPI003335F7E7